MSLTNDEKLELQFAANRMEEAAEAMLAYTESDERDSEKQRLLSEALRNAIAEFWKAFERLNRR